MCAMPCAFASDSLEEEELVAAEPVVVATEEPADDDSGLVITETEIVEEEIPADNVMVSDSKYITDTMDEIAKTRARVDELLLPRKLKKNLWMDDPLPSNQSIQSVVMGPMELPSSAVKKSHKHVQKAKNSAFTLGEQSYYGETVYIINNFLSGGADNVSEIDGNYTGDKTGYALGGKMLPEYKGCPFSKPAECAVWIRKPVVSETVSPRSKYLRTGIMCDISDKIEKNPNISANDKTMAPLLSRYRVLMRASQSCCTGGITYKLKKAGATSELIYKFLADDANFSGFGNRCLVMNDEQIDTTDKYEATAGMVADVRNGCICKSKTNIRALLAPFEQLYKEYPAFANAPFEYKHYDGVGRAVTDSVNADVQNVLRQLEMCP